MLQVHIREQDVLLIMSTSGVFRVTVGIDDRFRSHFRQLQRVHFGAECQVVHLLTECHSVVFVTFLDNHVTADDLTKVILSGRLGEAFQIETERTECCKVM